jgi:hypothetical protein
MPKRDLDPAPTCIAYRDDGSLCREEATILDSEWGGMVCRLHDPERWRRFCWTEEDAEGMTLTTADGTVIPLGDSGDEEDER